MMEVSVKTSSLERKVEPKGWLLNDIDNGIDHLGYSVHAEALAHLLHSVNTPLTVGIFAPWGSGKSFLLREVRSLLSKYQRQNNIDEAEEYTNKNAKKFLHRNYKSQGVSTRGEKRGRYCSCVCWTLFLLAFGLAVATVLVVALVPKVEQAVYDTFVNSNMTSTEEDGQAEVTQSAAEVSWQVVSPHTTITLSFLAVIVLLSVTGIVCLSFACCVATTNSKCWLKTTRNIRLVAYAAFTQLPTLVEKNRAARSNHYDIVIDFDEDAELGLIGMEEQLEPRNDNCLQAKYIFINFKAWEYSGSDTLWAAIVTNLTEAIEEEFGVVTCRLFRMFEVEEICDESRSREPCTVCVNIGDNETTASTMKDLMMKYGVVVECKRVKNCWQTRFSRSMEARNAMKSLRIAGLDVVMRNELQGQEEREHQLFFKAKSDSIHLEMDTLVTMSCKTEKKDCSTHNQLRQMSFCKSFLMYPKRVCCGCPFLYMCIIFLIAVILFPLAVCVLVSHLHLDVMRTSRAIPFEVQILAWMPATLAALVVVIQFCYAMFRSQTRRVQRALAGAQGNMATELGFMNKVKYEVKIIEKLVRCLRYTHKRNCKIVISIDDLDRCLHKKVKSVLEAVSILLSDPSSPFICLIALDSRVAVKCIEQNMGSALLQANINGHDYLKKIINLPFCLPELESRDKRRYLAGLMDQADRTKLKRKKPAVVKPAPKSPVKMSAGDIMQAEDIHKLPTTDSIRSFKEIPNDLIASPQSNTSDISNTSGHIGKSVVDRVDGVPFVDNSSSENEEEEVDEKEFLFLCRKYLHDDETLKYHLSGNPRNMKRIFNVISMTTQLIRSFEERVRRATQLYQFRVSPASELPADGFNGNEINRRRPMKRNAANAKAIVQWVVLTDQWPYRVSYLLQVIEDADQRVNAGRKSEQITNDTSLLDIYEKNVVSELNGNLNINESTLLSLDGDQDLFLGFLRNFPITKRKAKMLKRCTVNLDQSLRQNIALYRSLVDLQQSDKSPNPSLSYCN